MQRERQRACVMCNVSKPWSAFYAKTRWEDGTMRVPHAMCKECHLAYNRERRRERYPQQRERINELRRRRHAAMRARQASERHERIEIAPFREWLNEQRPDFDCDKEMAAWLGVNERVLFRWLHEAEGISVDHVDGVSCRVGEPQLLRELYPSLYEFDGQVAA